MASTDDVVVCAETTIDVIERSSICMKVAKMKCWLSGCRGSPSSHVMGSQPKLVTEWGDRLGTTKIDVTGHEGRRVEGQRPSPSLEPGDRNGIHDFVLTAISQP